MEFEIIYDKIENNHTTLILVKEDFPMLLKVNDLTGLDTEAEITAKKDAVNYSITEVAGKYYMLTLAAAGGDMQPPFDIENAKETGEYIVERMLKAADFWHDHVLSTNQ